MALTGLQIYKFLPRTNCKKCGYPTCLAFAMKLSQKGAELSSCPDISEEGKAALDSASRPPIQLVTIGKGDRAFAVGNETVLFRHEKTFVHQPGLLVRVRATDPADKVAATVAAVEGHFVERVGTQLRIDGFALDGQGASAGQFADLVASVKAKAPGAPLALISDDPAAMAAALEKCGGEAPLIYASSAATAGEMAKLALKYKAPLAVRAPSPNGVAGGLDGLSSLVEAVTQAGVVEVVVDPGTRGFGDSLAAATQVRRLALRKNYRPLGYPVISFPGEGAASPDEELMLAAQAISKYAGVIVLDSFSPEAAYTLLTLRMNIYTDPQKPIQVSPGVYPVRDPGPNAPLLVSTNFSLTYFSVLGEVEGAGVPAWMLIADSEGLSVLTAWAAGKFDAEKIAKAIKEFGVADKISHKKIIIPGLVATISGELEDELPGWQVLVGPREAVDIPAYLRRQAAN
jgi:acetyl-CoA decarbonylase/synthase, CODH/ACS complex subunit gamma